MLLYYRHYLRCGSAGKSLFLTAGGNKIMTKDKRIEEMERRKREQQKIFLDGLERYRRKGISILIDGKECPPEDFGKLFECRADGSFYMGDYIGADTGMLTEIRFDRVYYR